ncbi:phosphoribulokinase/uridine kinase [Flammeovirgaceae bacterium 311]|nr:phosphoribulokinase/uridine kinase [Flammeovirgaceae bacterium 311]
MKQPYIVGITGGSASGKTFFLRELLRNFTPAEVCLVSQDNYYRPRHEQPIDENGIQNFDTPQSIDHVQYAQDLITLKEGQTVIRQEYTFNNPNAVPKQLEFHPAPVIVVEGIFVFYFPDLTRHLDLKIFIEAEEHIKLSRRITRDKVERGYDLEDVLYRYERHVAPTYNKYIKPFRSDADLVVPNNDGFDNALEVITTFIKSKVS